MFRTVALNPLLARRLARCAMASDSFIGAVEAPPGSPPR